MIPWREKLIAFAIHFAVTALLSLAVAALIFLVWYPAPFHTMVGGTELFLLVIGCDLALGPLVSLVIYNSRKSRGKLLLDYCIVGILQLGALGYGSYIVWSARPIYVAFVGDRYETIAAGDLDDADILAARDPRYSKRPLWGPELVATYVPPEERNTVLMSSLSGKDVQVLPRYYVPYESQSEKLRSRAAPLTKLIGKHPEAAPLIEAACRDLGIGCEQLRWLPIRNRDGFWTVLIDMSTGKPARYLPIDPW